MLPMTCRVKGIVTRKDLVGYHLDDAVSRARTGRMEGSRRGGGLAAQRGLNRFDSDGVDSPLAGADTPLAQQA